MNVNIQMVKIVGWGNKKVRMLYFLVVTLYHFTFFFLFFGCPVTYGVPRLEIRSTRDQILASLATLMAALVTKDPLTGFVGPRIKSASWCCRYATDPTVP